jgi:hypothetical protein
MKELLGVALVDASLPQLDLLLTELSPGWILVPVEGTQDALGQLTAAISHTQLPDSWRLAVVAHGCPGEVKIGCERLTASSVQRRAQEWCALAPSAIDLYSCHTGADPSLASALSAVCGASVHASAGVVGHSSVGGSWELEVQSAQAAANAVVPFNRAAVAGWGFGLVVFFIIQLEGLVMARVVVTPQTVQRLSGHL